MKIRKKKKKNGNQVCSQEDFPRGRFLRQCRRTLLITASYQIFSVCLSPMAVPLPPAKPGYDQTSVSTVSNQISQFFVSPAIAQRCVMCFVGCTASCTGCIGGCTGCTGCKGCTGCTGCEGCTGCTGCEDCTGYTGPTPQQEAATAAYHGWELLNQERYSEAESYLRQAIAINPTALSYNNLGVALNRQGRNEEAKEAFREALRLDPSYKKARENLQGLEDFERRERGGDLLNQGLKLGEQGRYKEAEEASREAIRLNPQDARGHNNLGGALLFQGRYREAEKALREALRLDPNYKKAQSSLGMVLLEQERYREAEEAYRQAIRLDPNDAVVLNNLGVALWMQGRNQEAKEAYRQALKINPQHEKARENIAKIEREERQVDAGRAPERQVAKAPAPEIPGKKRIAPTTSGEQLKSAEFHSKKGANEAKKIQEKDVYTKDLDTPIERAKREAMKGFDTRGDHHGGLNVVDLRGMGKRPEWPSYVKDDPAIKALQTEQDGFIRTYQEKEKELSQLRQEMETAPPAKKSVLAVKEVKIKEEMSKAEYHIGFTEKKIRAQAKLIIDTRIEGAPEGKKKDQK